MFSIPQSCSISSDLVVVRMFIRIAACTDCIVHLHLEACYRRSPSCNRLTPLPTPISLLPPNLVGSTQFRRAWLGSIVETSPFTVSKRLTIDCLLAVLDRRPTLRRMQFECIGTVLVCSYYTPDGEAQPIHSLRPPPRIFDRIWPIIVRFPIAGFPQPSYASFCSIRLMELEHIHEGVRVLEVAWLGLGAGSRPGDESRLIEHGSNRRMPHHCGCTTASTQPYSPPTVRMPQRCNILQSYCIHTAICKIQHLKNAHPSFDPHSCGIL